MLWIWSMGFLADRMAGCKAGAAAGDPVALDGKPCGCPDLVLFAFFFLCQQTSGPLTRLRERHATSAPKSKGFPVWRQLCLGSSSR